MRMQKDNHFVEIRPRGSQRQYTLKERQILADDMSGASVEQADDINDARTAFAAACGLPHSRPNEVYRVLGHKVAFINSYAENITDMKIVDALLADRSTLCLRIAAHSLAATMKTTGSIVRICMSC